MLRGNWFPVFAAIGLTLVSPAGAHSNAAASGSNKIEASANRGAQREQGRAGSAVTPIDLGDRKKAIQPDCGTPKECRAEQRDKDDLVAQQIAAEAAVSQRNAAWWQTGVGAAGVILLILTVIYTHLATRSAINSVRTLIAVERARIAIQENDTVTTHDGKTGKFRMYLSNDGRSAGVLRETCITCSKTGLFKDFKPDNIKKQNKLIPMRQMNLFETFDFDFNDENRFIVGYYKFSTIFSDKLVTDYFCFEIGNAKQAVIIARRARQVAAGSADVAGVSQAGGEGKPPVAQTPKPKRGAPLSKPAVVPAAYRTDLDWPPDED